MVPERRSVWGCGGQGEGGTGLRALTVEAWEGWLFLAAWFDIVPVRAPCTRAHQQQASGAQRDSERVGFRVWI